MHASELERERSKAAETRETLLKKGANALSSQEELCEKMSDVCRQMKKVAEEAEKKSATSQEKAREHYVENV